RRAKANLPAAAQVFPHPPAPRGMEIDRPPPGVVDVQQRADERLPVHRGGDGRHPRYAGQKIDDPFFVGDRPVFPGDRAAVLHGFFSCGGYLGSRRTFTRRFSSPVISTRSPLGTGPPPSSTSAVHSSEPICT